MIDRELALRLHDGGLIWSPTVGDRFTLRNPAFAGEVFTLSDMTIEPQGTPDARVLGFNGTTEWALDSVEVRETLWLPREDQLRELLGDTFVRLERTPAGFEITLSGPDGGDSRVGSENAADAYALALLARMDHGAADDR